MVITVKNHCGRHASEPPLKRSGKTWTKTVVYVSGCNPKVVSSPCTTVHPTLSFSGTLIPGAEPPPPPHPPQTSSLAFDASTVKGVEIRSFIRTSRIRAGAKTKYTTWQRELSGVNFEKL